MHIHISTYVGGAGFGDLVILGILLMFFGCRRSEIIEFSDIGNHWNSQTVQ